MKDKLLKVLSKLHLSLLIIIILTGIFFILIAAPVQMYDRYVIDRDKKCFTENAGDWITVDDSKDSDTKFDPDKYLSEKNRNASEFYNKTEEAMKKCKVTLSKYSETIVARSNSVILDNYPRPLEMFYIGLGFFGFAILLVLAKKWTIWLFK